MTPGPRGWVVMALVATVSAWAGWTVAGKHSDSHWVDNWTYAHVAWDTKGNRK